MGSGVIPSFAAVAAAAAAKTGASGSGDKNNWTFNAAANDKTDGAKGSEQSTAHEAAGGGAATGAGSAGSPKAEEEKGNDGSTKKDNELLDIMVAVIATSLSGVDLESVRKALQTRKGEGGQEAKKQEGGAATELQQAEKDHRRAPTEQSRFEKEVEKSRKKTQDLKKQLKDEEERLERATSLKKQAEQKADELLRKIQSLRAKATDEGINLKDPTEIEDTVMEDVQQQDDKEKGGNKGNEVQAAGGGNSSTDTNMDGRAKLHEMRSQEEKGEDSEAKRLKLAGAAGQLNARERQERNSLREAALKELNDKLRDKGLPACDADGDADL